LAVDIDTLAVRVATENAERNDLVLGDVLAIQQGSVPANKTGHFQVIVANILAEVLVGLFNGQYGDPPLAEPLAPGGHLILSGILADRAQLVIDAAARYGLRLVDRKQEDDWVALIVQR
jgi:ribosomal protein L11 methyltransferase